MIINQNQNVQDISELDLARYFDAVHYDFPIEREEKRRIENVLVENPQLKRDYDIMCDGLEDFRISLVVGGPDRFTIDGKEVDLEKLAVLFTASFFLLGRWKSNVSRCDSGNEALKIEESKDGMHRWTCVADPYTGDITFWFGSRDVRLRDRKIYVTFGTVTKPLELKIDKEIDAEEASGNIRFTDNNEKEEVQKCAKFTLRHDAPTQHVCGE
jgi:hypothetical protein